MKNQCIVENSNLYDDKFKELPTLIKDELYLIILKHANNEIKTLDIVSLMQTILSASIQQLAFSYSLQYQIHNILTSIFDVIDSIKIFPKKFTTTIPNEFSKNDELLLTVNDFMFGTYEIIFNIKNSIIDINFHPYPSKCNFHFLIKD